jgi:hypothetical protein
VSAFDRLHRPNHRVRYARPGGGARLRDRLALIEAAKPVLAGASAVATLDVALGGERHQRRIIDLAGVTDAEIAALPGDTHEGDLGCLFDGEGARSTGFPDRRSRERGRDLFARTTETRPFADPLIALAPTR